MNTRISFAVSAMIMLGLTGCDTQSQLQEQTTQLQVIQMTLAQIQVSQQQAISLQKTQAALQAQNNNLQMAHDREVLDSTPRAR